MLTVIKIDEAKIPVPDKDGYCRGYKITKQDSSSPYFEHVFAIGENVSNRTCKCSDKKCPNCRDLNPTDKKELPIVGKGFHLFPDFKKATKYIETCHRAPEPQYFHGYKIIEVFYKPEDVIAYGLSGSDFAVAVMKLDVRSLEEIKL